MTNAQLVDAWLNGVQRAHNRRYSLQVVDGNLYSYGAHYLLAVNRRGTVLVNDERYSVTTSRHASLVMARCAARGIPTLRGEL